MAGVSPGIAVPWGKVGASESGALERGGGVRAKAPTASSGKPVRGIVGLSESVRLWSRSSSFMGLGLPWGLPRFGEPARERIPSRDRGNVSLRLPRGSREPGTPICTAVYLRNVFFGECGSPRRHSVSGASNVSAGPTPVMPTWAIMLRAGISHAGWEYGTVFALRRRA
jgi:hypothetical protein